MVWITDGEKILMLRLLSLTAHMNVTDRWTHCVTAYTVLMRSIMQQKSRELKTARGHLTPPQQHM